MIRRPICRRSRLRSRLARVNGIEAFTEQAHGIVQFVDRPGADRPSTGQQAGHNRRLWCGAQRTR
jgi:hypothetical protein